MAAVSVLGSLYATAVLASHAAAFREAARRRVAEERNRADRLLLDVLPRTVAARLLRTPGTIADSHAHVTVLFADLVGFTNLSATLSSDRLVGMLNELFSELDKLAARHGLEKIKTIGDAYMVAAGLPGPHPDPTGALAELALDMVAVVRAEGAAIGEPLDVRIGLHAGPVVAGVIGKRKHAYDLWGDAVNTAARMESHGLPGTIQVTEAAARRLEARYRLAPRGVLDIKGKGPMRTWFLVGERAARAETARPAIAVATTQHRPARG